MNKTTEALKLAKEALEKTIAGCEAMGWTTIAQKQALAAIREALAEPDIEEMTLTQIASRHEPVTQEPVAEVEITYGREPECYVTGNIDNFPEGVFKLYAAPVSAEREWVDITKAEQLYLLASHIDKLTGDVMGLSLIDAVVAKFKEKNK